MKPVLKAGLLIAALISFLATSAQTSKKIDSVKKFDARINAQFTKTLTRAEKVKNTDLAELKKFASQKPEDDLSTDQLRAIEKDIENTKQAIENKQKQYIPSSRNKHTIDNQLLALLAEVPEPIANLPEAKKASKIRYDETPYAKYIAKIENQQEQLEAIARKKLPEIMKDPEAAKAAAYKSAAKAQESINNNVAIQEMGGLEKLKNMTPAQREAMAKQMAEKIRQNPMAYTGNDGDPGMAFTKKMMSDPSYAARYNAMNDAQKKEEYEAFMKENGFVQKTTQADRNKVLAERDRTLISMDIEKKLQHVREHVEELAKLVGAVQVRTDEYFRDVNDRVGKEYAARIAALPLVEMGEYGHGKETYPVDITFQAISYQINIQQAVANRQIWKRYVDMFKVVIEEYNEFFAEYLGRDKVTDELLLEKAIIPEGIMAGLCGEMIRFAKMASFQTTQNGGWQKVYDEKVLAIGD